MILNIEDLDEEAANYQQRKKRLNFYQKHGFHETGFSLKEGSTHYWVLCTKPDIDIKTMQQVVKIRFACFKPSLSLYN